MSIRQLKQRAGQHRARNGAECRRHEPGKLRVVHDLVPQLPPRPDSSVLNDSIPLFFIGRNAAGFWVARESEGCCGGLFLLRGSAVRYAKRASAPAGCATMLLDTPLELDLPNQGSRLAGSLAPTIVIAERRAPAVVSFLRMAAAEWRNLVQQISRALTSERRNREAIEKELFHGQYKRLEKRRRSAGPLSRRPRERGPRYRTTRRTMMKVTPDSEPPSRRSCPFFLLGQDSQGYWVVCEQNGARGGLFINRAEALRYIRSENENHAFPTVMVAGVLELNIAETKNKFISAPSTISTQRQLKVA